MNACSVDGCDRDASRAANGKRGFCSLHYQRVRKFGDPHEVRRTPSPAQDWLRAHVTHAGDDCLIWPFATGADGYGRAHRPKRGSLTTASHLMCELAHGPRPSRIHEAAHSCGNGNKGCVNPRHVYWATPTENQRDRIEHGTSNRGTQQGASRLTDDDVRAIRAATCSQADLAMRYGVDQSHINKIIHRRAWAWLP